MMPPEPGSHLRVASEVSTDVIIPRLGRAIAALAAAGTVAVGHGHGVRIKFGRTGGALSDGLVAKLITAAEAGRVSDVSMEIDIPGVQDPALAFIGNVSPSRESRGSVAFLTYFIYAAGDDPLCLSVDEFVASTLDLLEAGGFPQAAMLPGRSAMWHVVDRVRLGPRLLNDYLHGETVGWGTWLTAGHLERLGGRDRVLADAPAARIEVRPGGVWLEATESPFQCELADVIALSQFLAPLFITQEQAWQLDPVYFYVPGQEADAGDSGSTASAADRYPGDDHGRVVVDGLERLAMDTTLTVYFAVDPSDDARDAVGRAMIAWYADGADEAFGDGFHDINGPSVDRGEATWTIDFGHSDAVTAIDDLSRRLANWAHTWSIPIEKLEIN